MNKISSVLWKLGMQVAIQIQKVVRGWDVWFRKLKQVLSVHLLIHFPLYSEKKNPFSCSSFSIVWSEIAQGKKLKICDKTRTIFWPLMGGGSFCWTTWEQSSSDGMPAPFWLEFPPVRKGAPPTTTRTSERLLACTGGGGWGVGRGSADTPQQSIGAPWSWVQRAAPGRRIYTGCRHSNWCQRTWRSTDTEKIGNWDADMQEEQERLVL